MSTPALNFLNGHTFVIATHHKCGTALMSKVFERLTNRLGISFERITQQEVENGEVSSRVNKPCIAFDIHSKLDISTIPFPTKSIHCIRDPREIAVSGYFYHLKCAEEWCRIPNAEYGGMSYQDLLRSKPQAEGLLLEIKLITNGIFQQMSKWKASAGESLEVRFEDILNNYDDIFKKIFQFLLGPDSEFLETCLSIASSFNLKNQTPEQLKQNSHVTNYELRSGRWKEYLNSEHMDLVRHLFVDFITEKGYEN